MKHALASIVITALTAGGVATAVSGVPASAAAQGVRTYSETVSITITGKGKDAKFLDHTYFSQQVILRPGIAFYRLLRHETVSPQGKQSIFKGQYYLVGGNDYSELNGAKTWTMTPAAPGEVSRDATTLNVMLGLAKFRAIPGLTRSAPHEYQVTGKPAAVGAFLAFEYGITAHDLTSMGIKSVTITLTTDSAGRPLTYTVVAKSKLRKIVVTETVSGYNQPLTIQPPK